MDGNWIVALVSMVTGGMGGSAAAYGVAHRIKQDRIKEFREIVDAAILRAAPVLWNLNQLRK